MKIGILTQPLHTNYGGLLQCYALMNVLRRMGHQPEIISREHHSKSDDLYGRIYRVFHHVQYSVHHLVWTPMISKKQKDTVAQNTNKFVRKYINPRTPLLYTNKQLVSEIRNSQYDAFIAGSDQCWRPRYSPCITNYFFDFARNIQCKRLAYAASFGVDSWEYDKQDTAFCSILAKQFDAISVREASGVKLCKNHLGVEAEHVLDPTMLLEREDYEAIVKAEGESESIGSLFCYILDRSSEKQKIIQKVSESCDIKPFSIMPKLDFTPDNAHRHLEDCIFPSVTSWLRAFMDAKMVLTDSFHGCVFSIIFNKPFWVIGNRLRGLSRFDSILHIFGLQSRLIVPDAVDNMDWNVSIDWNTVNSKWKEWQKKSFDFLKKNL